MGSGRTPGGFGQRERGATENETLVSLLIDRPVRPLFPEGFSNEINVIAQVLSYDGECEPDMVAMVAASAALTLSGVPFMGPIAAARVGYVDGDYVLNPTNDQVTEGDLRSEEHTSELQSLMRISSAVFCLKKTNEQTNTQ